MNFSVFLPTSVSLGVSFYLWLFLTMLRLLLAQQFFQIKWSSKIFNTELK